MWILWILGVAVALVAAKFYFGGHSCHWKPDLSGKTALITGGSAGIGKETAKVLASLGARVIFTGRQEKGVTDYVKNAAIKAGQENPQVEFIACELDDLENIKNLAAQVKQKVSSLDFLINNAGLTNPKLEYTKQGFESTLGVNLVSHVYLTDLLLPLLRKSKEARIINVSSMAYVFGLDSILKKDGEGFADFMLEKTDHNQYRWMQAYTLSKIGNILFSRKLAQLLESN